MSKASEEKRRAEQQVIDLLLYDHDGKDREWSMALKAGARGLELLGKLRAGPHESMVGLLEALLCQPGSLKIESHKQWAVQLLQLLRSAPAKVCADERDALSELRERGLETIEECDGHAVFTGCEGDSPDFCAFFASQEDAEAFIALKDPDDPECARLFDPAIVVATLTENGIVAANDYAIETHEQLRTRSTERTRSSP